MNETRIPVQGGLSSYSSTTYVHILECENGQVNKRRLEKKTIISSRSYRTLVNQMADPERNQLKQRRICFLWEGVHVKLVLLVLASRQPVAEDRLPLFFLRKLYAKCR
jgi:hypothetical protein